MPARAQSLTAQDEWSQVRELFNACLDLSPKDRENYLRSCGASPQALSEVRALLAALDNTDSTKITAPATSAPGLVEHERYVLVELIAKGGMAEVYRGKLKGSSGFEKPVAIKRILPDFVDKPKLKALFEDEARLSASLHHPNIVQVYDFVEYEGGYLLAMELIEGITLSKLDAICNEQGRRLPEHLALLIIDEILKALEYAHTRPLRIVHRDVSPKNVMLGTDGTVKLIDFGIAKSSARNSKTETGMVRGTFNFLSPEQAKSEAVDARSDVFSAGAVLFQLLSGRYLFSTDPPQAVLALIADCDKHVAKQLATLQTSAPVREALSRAVKARREDRLPSAAEFRHALATALPKNRESAREELAACVREVRAGRNLPKWPPSLPRQTSPRDRGRTFVFYALAVMTVLASLGIELVRRSQLVPSVPAPPAVESKFELTVGKRAKVYIDGKFLGEMQSGQAFGTPLRTGRRYRFRFVTENPHAETLRDFEVTPNETLHAMVSPGASGNAPGRVVFTVDSQVKVTLGDKRLGEIKPREPFEVSVPSGRKVRLRFNDVKRGLIREELLLLDPGSVIQLKISMEPQGQ